MDKHTHSLGTMDDLRKSGGTPAISFADLPADERASMIGIILDHFGYVNLSREDKGVVRVFLQHSTGYSRAQVARYITAHLKTVHYYKPEIISKVQRGWKMKMFPALALTLLLLLSGAINHQATGDVLSVLNAERTTGSGDVVTGTSRTMIVKTGGAQLLAIHEEPGETLVTWSVNALLKRVEARRIARLRLNENRNPILARPDIAIEKEIYPAYDPSRSVHAAANDPWDIPASGVEGQILMIQNGKPVWRDFPYLEQIRSEAPHGNESTRRAGGNRSGGSQNTVENNTTTTTVIQQVGGGSASSGWTDGGPFVYLTDDTANVGIGVSAPKTKLEVAGTISGSSLTVNGSITGASLYIASSIAGAGLTDCDALTSKITYDATLGQFVCGVDQTVGTGLSQATGDLRYVKKQGDSMTGALTIRITGGSSNTVGLNVINAISGAVIHAQNSLTTSGTLVFEGAASGSSLYIASSLQGVGLTDCDAASQTLNWDASTGRFSCGTDADTTYQAGHGLTLNGTAFSLNASLTGSSLRFQTISGSVVRTNSLNSSGSLIWEGAASGASLWVSSFDGAGLTDCDLSTNKLIWDATTKRFSCSTDQNTTAWSNTGSLQLHFDSRYLRTSGGTLTGSLVLRSTLSGASLLTLSNYHGCTLKTSATGAVICSTDIDTNTTYQAGQGLTLNGTSFSLNATITGALVRFTTISGSTVYAKNQLASSGSLAIEGNASIDGTTFFVDSSADRVGIGTSSPSAALHIVGDTRVQSGNLFVGVGKLILGGNGINELFATISADSGQNDTTFRTFRDFFFETNTGNGTAGTNRFTIKSTTGNVGIGTIAPDTALEVIGTVSGSSIHAQNALSSSGSLKWEGAGSGSSLYIASSLQGVGLTDCDAASQVLKWDATTGRFSCGTATNNTFGSGNVITIGDSKYVNVGGDTMTGTLTLTPQSGAALNARGTLSGSSLLTLSNYRGCTLKTSATGAVICGTDNGTSYYAGQGLTLNGSVFSLNSTITGSLVRFTTISGSTLYAKNQLASSGTLVTESGVIIDAGTFYVDATSNRVGIGTTAPTDLLTVRSSSPAISLLNSGNSQTWKIQNNGDFNIYDANTNKVRFTIGSADGNTSIGTGVTVSNSRLYVWGGPNGANIDVRGDSSIFGGDQATIELEGRDYDVDPNSIRMTYYGGEHNVGTTMGFANNKLGVLEWQGINTAIINVNANKPLLFGTDNTERMRITQTGSVGIGTTTPHATLDVLGSVSGSTLTLSGLKNCDTIDTDAQGNLVCGSDATGGSGAPEVGTASFSGAVVRLGNTQWVKKSGDTMTGTLTLTPASGVALNARGTISGSSLFTLSNYRGCTLKTSATGAVICGSDNGTSYYAGQGLTLTSNVFTLNSTITGALVRFTTISGSIITAKTSLASSGSLTWEGAASGATLWVSTFEGAGLTDCDASTNKVIWDDTLNRFSCGTDLNTTAWSNTGSILTAADSKYVNIGGDTMTGALTINVTGGNINTLGLKVMNTLSGASLHAESQLTVSGTTILSARTATQKPLIVRGAASQSAKLTEWQNSVGTLKAWVHYDGTMGIGTSDDTYNGALIVGGQTKIVGSAGQDGLIVSAGNVTLSNGSVQVNTANAVNYRLYSNGTNYGFIQNDTNDTWSLATGTSPSALGTPALTWLKSGAVGIGTITPGSKLSVSGAVIIGTTIGSAAADSNIALEIIGTASGRTIYAQQTLSSSGSLTWEGAGSGSSLYIASSLQGIGLTDCDAASQVLKWDATSGRFSCGTATNNSFGSGNVVTIGDSKYVNIGGDTMTGSLVINPVSGVALNARGTISGSSLLTLSNYRGCNLETSATGAVICGTDDGTTYYAGQGLTLSSNVFRLNSTITGSLVRFTTISGSTLYAKNLLASSGTLVTESGAYFDGTTLVVAAGPNRVGIGTAAPKTALEVQGTISGALLYQGGGGVKNYLQGSLGIGADAGAYILNLYNPTSTSFMNIESGNGASNGSVRVANADRAWVFGVRGDNNDGFGIADQTAGATRFILTSAGNVGIGTTGEHAKLEVAGTISGTLLSLNAGTSNLPALSFHGDEHTGLYWAGQDTLRLVTGGTDRVTINSSGHLGIGTNSPGSRLSVSGAVVIGNNVDGFSAKAQLDVKGSISGSSLTISSLRGCDSIDTDAQGNLVCGTDATGGSGAPEVGTSSFSGAVIRLANTQYVKKSGDTMTGTLVIANGKSLQVAGTISGTTLKILGTGSGNIFHAEKSLSTSGSLTWEGAGSGSSLYIASSLQGVGLSDCDAATSQLKWDVTTGRFSCGTTFAEVGTSSFSGAVIRLANTQYVKKSGDTMTGTLVIANGKSLQVAGTISGTALKILGTGSGNIFHAEKSLTSSGTLVTESGAYFDGTTMVIQAGSNRVGIGTASPLAPLHVASSSAGSIPALDGGTVGLFEADGSSGAASVLQIISGNAGNAVVNFGDVDDINIGQIYYNHLNNSMNFAVNNALLMVMSGSKVGIGTVTPKAKLDVLGTISGALITQNGAGSNYFLGNVGIGVASPSAKLHVSSLGTSGTATEAMRLSYTNALNTAGYISMFAGNSTTETQRITYGLSAATTNGYLAFSTYSTGLSEAMRIIGNGSLGIGTTTPKAKLTVFGSGAFTGTLSGSALNIQGGTSYILGNVGIGKTAPSTKLEVAGTISGSLLSLNGTGSTTIMNYKVGIGTTSPAYKLDINGQMRARAQFQSYVADGFDSLNGLPGITVTTPTANSKFMVGYQDAGGGQYHPAIKFLHSSTSDLAMIISQVSGDTQPYFKILDSGKMQWGPGGSTVVDTNLFRSNANVLHTDDDFTGSGILLIKTVTKSGSGAATFVPAEFQTGAYISGSGAAVLALDVYTNTGSRTPHILFGYRGNFDTGLYRVGKYNSGALALRVANSFSNNAASAFEIYSNAGHTNNKVFRVATNGATFSDGAYASTGADYAEWFMSKDNLLPGEVVCIDITKKNSVKRCTTDADGNVMGIVSTNPSFVGNQIGGAEGLMPPGYVLVGLIGQVPAKVMVENGEAIRPGDSLTAASVAGYARKARAGESTVGVALEGLTSGQGLVNVLISRRNQSLTVEAVEDEVLKTIADMQIEDEVQLMVSFALGDLNVDEQISDEVTRQVNALAVQKAEIDTIKADIEQLKTQVAANTSETGTTVINNIVEPVVSTGGHLTASTMEIEDTLITGGDTRIGGDLSIDGTLNASSLFVPNGLTIDGGVVMNGLFDAQELHVSSGATIDGVLTINGRLNLGSGASLNFGSGALTLSQLIVENSLFVMGDITIQGMATFLGTLSVHGELIVSGNQAGFAMIPATGTGVTVHFGSGFTGTPVVTASPDIPVLYAVTKSSATGFTIRIAEPAAADITFAWHALSTNAPLTIRAEVAPSGSIVFPMASDNIPVSSNMVWNACIRNITVLDDQGQPLSCGRYHESYNWTHPDLGITFIWNTSLTPALLQLPEGYEAEVTEDAQSIIDAINGTEEEGVETETTQIIDTGSTTATGSVTPEVQPVTEEVPAAEEVAPVVEDQVIEDESATEQPVTSDAPSEEPVVEQNTTEPEVIE